MGFFDKLKKSFGGENDKQPQAAEPTTQHIEKTEDDITAGATINGGSLTEIFDHGTEHDGAAEVENAEVPVVAEDPVVEEPAVVEEPDAAVEEPAAVDEPVVVEEPDAAVEEPAPAEQPTVQEETPLATEPEPTRTYTVEAGDNLSQIGEQFGVDHLEIARINGIDNPDLIFPGQVLRIP